MYLVVGLGNPDKKYHETFHNVGFQCVDSLAQSLAVRFDKGECRAVTAHTRVNGEKVILAKPVTYMNLSGESVLELVNKYKIEKGKLAVVYDDVDLPVGSVRIRESGSAGTHNGMRNIIALLKAEDIVRIRVGIGGERPREMELADYVLSKVSDADKIKLIPAIQSAAAALKEFVAGMPAEQIMQKHNIIKSSGEA